MDRSGDVGAAEALLESSGPNPTMVAAMVPMASTRRAASRSAAKPMRLAAVPAVDVEGGCELEAEPGAEAESGRGGKRAARSD